MSHLPTQATNDDLIRFVDKWAGLMELEDYQSAFNFTAHDPCMGWTPELIREVIKSYDECRPTQKVTVVGKPTDIPQRKEVSRWPQNRYGSIGQIWYDLNIDGLASDLTATFDIRVEATGLTICLQDIHVM